MEQMTLKEKLAFLRGFTAASQLSGEEREIFKKFFDFLEAVASSIEELNDKIDNLDAVYDYLEDRIETVENELYSSNEENGEGKEEV
jgi:septation ring formation regulator EzrA